MAMGPFNELLRHIMTVKELIDKLSTIELDSQILIRFMNEEGWKDLEYFDEDDIKINGSTIIIDISNK